MISPFAFKLFLLFGLLYVICDLTYTFAKRHNRSPE